MIISTRDGSECFGVAGGGVMRVSAWLFVGGVGSGDEDVVEVEGLVARGEDDFDGNGAGQADAHGYLAPRR